ncbi:T9SS type A sorting domain-containing protein [Hwangdonia lutea]|uniref:T9SS type A sorting domain-containing protein n=1 Tax=Hwangdonia lutea TaxID=3075823 RepID=A0AA97HRQ9_9FLAO|nr:T9SS type A sorting domain-containing protein [Hwangdonia sp. SCSIO 19198]WOD44897.1 T9SS type A sorting domain-containing protein [Hwangdonia sp. SCSIO 19198]
MNGIPYFKRLALLIVFVISAFSYGQCGTETATWNGSTWIWTGGITAGTVPTIGNALLTVITGNYTTNATNGSFSACNLTILGTLNIANGYYIEIEDAVTVDGGDINVSEQGAFIQNGVNLLAGTFITINSGSASLVKTTRNYVDSGLHYTYWSSPVTNNDITTVFPNPDDGRRFFYDGSNFLDEHTVGTTNNTPDDIDDDGNDWQVATGAMTPGLGYAVTAIAPPLLPFPFPYNDSATFTGVFNTGDIEVTIYRNDNELMDSNWNLVGNPYPSAINLDDFLDLNTYDFSTNPTGTIGGTVYLWTHMSTASGANPGNQVNNFSQDDYATVNKSGGTAAVNGGETPNKYIPSGQGFFVTFANNAPTTGGTLPVLSNTVKFNNDMRVTGNNDQFFKTSNSKNKPNNTNRLWVNLTSDNGVFNQVLVAYIDSATSAYDGEVFDAPKNTSSGAPAILYTLIDSSNKKFVIQGKSPNDLDEHEIVNLGFKTTIDVATLYTLSAQLEGDYLNNNTVYLKDNLLAKTHNLTASDYSFTSDTGEFNDRFQIVFSNKTLATNDISENENSLRITALDNDRVNFKASNHFNINTVRIYDLLGRPLYNLKGANSSETYQLSKLKNTVYIAKVELSTGAIITKKVIKR